MRRTVPYLKAVHDSFYSDATNRAHSLPMTKIHFHSPPTDIPPDIVMRIANAKQLVLMDTKDPKFGINTHVDQVASCIPTLHGKGGRNPSVNYFTRSGLMQEIPPIPVYRKHIWCNGHIKQHQGHPMINIKCLPGKVTQCKWCRLKFINMSSPDDCDDDWQEVEHKIATTPESKEDLMTPWRGPMGELREKVFMNEPDPFVYRAVLNPEKYRWKHEEHHDYEVHPRYAKKCGDKSCSSGHH
jgi:hypothetical protein